MPLAALLIGAQAGGVFLQGIPVIGTPDEPIRGRGVVSPEGGDLPRVAGQRGIVIIGTPSREVR